MIRCGLLSTFPARLRSHLSLALLLGLSVSAPPAQVAEDPKARQHAYRSFEFARSGDLKKAEQEMRAAIKVAPENPLYLSGLAGILLRQGRREESRDYFQKASQLDPGNAIFRVQLATRQWELGELSSAKQNLETVLRKEPDQQSAKLLLGMVETGLGSCPIAVKHFEAVLDLVKIRPETTLALASCYYETKQGERAQLLLEQLVSSGKATAPVYALLANRQAAQGRTNEAIRSFELAIEKQPEREQSYLELGALLGRVQRFRAGNVIATRAAERFPNSALSQQMAGFFAWKSERNVAAVEFYERALELDPNSADANVGLGIAQTKAGMTGEAARTLETGIRRFAWHAPHYEAFGVLLVQLADAGEAPRSRAVGMFESALKLNSSLPESHYQLGNMALAEGKLQEAFTHLTAAAQGASSDSRVHYALFRTYRRMGRPRDADRELERYHAIKKQEKTVSPTGRPRP